MYLFEFLEKYYSQMSVDIEALKGKTILVTGSNGLIGSNFINYFYWLNKSVNCEIKIIAHSFSEPVEWLPNDESITYLSSDLNESDLDFYFDYLIHAATYGQPKKVIDNKMGTILLNTSTYIKLLNIARNNKAKVLFLSSSSVYGEITEDFVPTPESYNGNLDTLSSGSLYAESKRVAEVISKAYIDDCGMDIKIARVGITYGPGTRLNDKRFINEFAQSGLNNFEILMMDRGRALRQVCFITDGLEMLINILLYGKDIIYNVGGGGEAVSIFSMASLIAKFTGAKVVLPKVENGVVGAQNIVHINIDKYCKEFGKNKFVSISKGFNCFVEWAKYLKKQKS